MEKAGTRADYEWVYGCVTDYYEVDFTLSNPPQITLPENVE
jgi:hypothetical protein